MNIKKVLWRSLLEMFNRYAVPPNAAITSEWPLLLYVQFTCNIYGKFFLLLLKVEEVEKLGCKLSGYIWGQFAWDTPFYKRS